MARVQITAGRRREPAAIRSWRIRIAGRAIQSESFRLKTTTPKRLLLFDIDGTLVNTGGAGVQALKDVARAQHRAEEDLRGIEIAGRTDSGIVRQILGKQNIEPTEKNVARFLDAYADGLRRELPLCAGTVLPGIGELLRHLQALPDVVLALLTGNIERGAKLKLEYYGLWHFFEFGAFGDDHHDRNELGRFARTRAREKHSVDFAAGNIDVIGDTPHDVACGKAIGARTIAVATGSFSEKELAKHEPDFIIPDFSDYRQRMEQFGWSPHGASDPAA